ncbi:MAG: hypothetical protein ACRCZP_08245 [Phycicoccus sp.]
MATTARALIPVPELTTPAQPDIPADLLALANVIDSRLVNRYASVADRTAKNPSPANGELGWLTDSGTLHLRVAGAWVPIYTPVRRCEVINTTSQAIAAGTVGTKLSWTTEVEDLVGFFTVGAGDRMTVPSDGAGRYDIDVTIQVAATNPATTTAQRVLRLNINNVLRWESRASPGLNLNGVNLHASGVALAAGDVLDVFLVTVDATTTPGSIQQRWAITRTSAS